mmetsp:Transcript_25102/g.35389  ORF Transcript_25102/g.35389 Transcript_25102/m.35389 type:complete len:958 (-) Transcript_25102:39-2912(-)
MSVKRTRLETLFAEDNADDKTMQKVFEAYADSKSAALTAAQMQEVISEIQSIVRKRNASPSVVPLPDEYHHDDEDNLNTAEEFQRFEKAQAEKVEAYIKEVPTILKSLVPLAESKDTTALARFHPTDRKVLRADDVELGVIVSDPRLYYTWDLCIVFDLGPDILDDLDLSEGVWPPEDDDDDDDDDDNSDADEKKSGSKKKKTPDDKKRAKLRKFGEIVGHVKTAGLETFLYLSVQSDEVYCMVGATEHRLKREAERVEFEVELDPKKAREHAKQIGMVTQTGDEDTWAHLYGKFVYFQRENPDTTEHKIYKTYPMEGEFHPQTPFTQTNRIKLIHSIIGAETMFGGACLAMKKLMGKKVHPMIAFFPVHHHPKRLSLIENMGWLSVFKPPLDQIKDYYGEQLGLYFAFLSLYTKFLIPAGIVGLGFTVGQALKWEVDFDGMYVFGVLICIWTTTFLEYLKREVARLRVRWGMDNFHEIEAVRPEFEGETRHSPITGKFEEFFDPLEKLRRLAISYASIITYVAALIGAVIGTLLFRVVLKDEFNMLTKDITLISAVVNAVVINVFNAVYGKISEILNDYENHKTDTAHENAKIGKTFGFKLFNSFNVLVIIAFLKSTSVGEPMGYCKGSFAQAANKVDFLTEYFSYLRNYTCDIGPTDYLLTPMGKKLTNFTDSKTNYTKLGEDALRIAYEKIDEGCVAYRGDCMYELFFQLLVIFALGLVLNNGLEIGVPLIKSVLAKRAQSSVGHLDDAELNDAFEETLAHKSSLSSHSKIDASNPSKKDKASVVKEFQEMRKSDPEKEFEMVQHEGTFGEYDELVVQFGFVILFVIACPLTPFLALMNNIVEFRLDSQKILRVTRRPHPKGAYDIGAWATCLTTLAWLGLITNTLLVIFTSSVFKRVWSVEEFTLKAMILFVAVEHCLFGIKMLVDYYIPDEPAEVDTQLTKQRYLCNALGLT